MNLMNIDSDAILLSSYPAYLGNLDIQWEFNESVHVACEIEGFARTVLKQFYLQEYQSPSIQTVPGV